MFNFAIMNNLAQVDNYFRVLNDIEKKNCPEHLFYSGDFSLLERGRRVAVVGSREVSNLGERRTRKIVDALVSQDIIVVSGLAKGVDTIAHKRAMELGGETIAVLGTPLEVSYPAVNKKLQSEIALSHLLLSQFPAGQVVHQSNFPLRNRTMALVSDATIIVEATEKSGTRHQGWECLRLGRTLYILENVLQSVSWASAMLEYGAIVLSSSDLSYAIENIPYLTSREELDVF